MTTPKNLAAVMRGLKEAADILQSAALAAERNPGTKPVAIRLLKMADEADRYSQYIGAYFSQKDETD